MTVLRVVYGFQIWTSMVLFEKSFKPKLSTIHHKSEDMPPQHAVQACHDLHTTQEGENQQYEVGKTPPVHKEHPPHEFRSPPSSIIDKKNNTKYIRRELLGVGGFARVYEVEDSHGTLFAAKVVTKSSLIAQKNKNKLFAEIKIHQSMSHPHIVKFYNCFEDSLNVYMVMELCENKTLMDMLKKRRRLTEYEARFYMLQILDACTYMHTNHVIHRDLKLGNLFLTRNMNIKLGDFGLAALIQMDGERKKTICGTPNYIAPEILFDQKNGHSYEVDLWSIGVILYTLLIGRPPFQTKEVKLIYRKIKEIKYDFPATAPISSNAKNLIQRLLSKADVRPHITQIINHPWFTQEGTPKSIPHSALSEEPTFDTSDLMLPVSLQIEPDMDNNRISPGILKTRSENTSSLDTKQNIIISREGKNEAQLKSKNFKNLDFTDSAQPIRIDATLSTSRQRKLSRTQSENICPEQGEKLNMSTRQSVMSNLGPKISQISRNSTAPSIQPEKASRPKSTNVTLANKAVVVNESLIPVTRQRKLSQMMSDIGRGSGTLAGMASIGQNGSDKQSMLLDSLNGKGNFGSSIANHLATDFVSSITGSISRPKVLSNSDKPSPMGIIETMCVNVERVFNEHHEKKVDPLSKSLKVQETLRTPPVFMSKWIDYSNKYGLGYTLTDGCVGVYFNDSTTIVLAPDECTFEYISYNHENKGVMTRKLYPMKDYPVELQKKVFLLKHFRDYMSDHLFKADLGVANNANKPVKKSNMDFLTKYLRTKHAVIFRMSNRIVQINFIDHTKMILFDEGNSILYINKKREFSIWAIEDILISQQSDLIGRLKYAKDILNQLLGKKLAKKNNR